MAEKGRSGETSHVKNQKAFFEGLTKADKGQKPKRETSATQPKQTPSVKSGLQLIPSKEKPKESQKFSSKVTCRESKKNESLSLTGRSKTREWKTTEELKEEIKALKKIIADKRREEETEIQELMKQLKEQEKKISELESSTGSHYDRHRQDIKSADRKDQDGKTIEKLKEEMKGLKKIIADNRSEEGTEIQELKKRLKEREKKIVELESSIGSHYDRADITPRRVAGIEDVCSKNRPTQVADAYSNLMNNQWLDAFMELPDEPEDVKSKTLLEIMKISWTVANTYLDETGTKIALFIEDPFVVPSERRTTKKAMPAQIERQAIDIIKEMSDQHDTTNLTERSMDEIINKGHLLNRKSCENIREYIDECCRVAWKMVLQQPQMKLAAPKDRLGQVVDPLKEDIYADSKPKGVISNYVKAGVAQEDKYFVKALVYLK